MSTDNTNQMTRTAVRLRPAPLGTGRLFFWDEAKAETGLVELRGSETLHISRIKQRLARIAKDAKYRRQFARHLKFPLERYW